jgi:MFS transporter, DHA2 family, multidrug resistance protein
MALVAQEIARQAQMQAFDDLFWFIGWVTFAILPLPFMMKRPERTGPTREYAGDLEGEYRFA